MQILGITILLLFIAVCIKNIEQGFWIGYFFILAYPMGTYVDTLALLDIVRIGDKGISLVHCIPITLLLVFAIKNIQKKKMSKFPISLYNICIVLLFMTYVQGVIIAILKQSPFLQDFQKFLVGYMWIILAVCILKQGEFEKFFFVSTIGLLCNCIFGILMAVIPAPLAQLFVATTNHTASNMMLMQNAGAYILPLCFMFIVKQEGMYKNIIYLIAGLFCLIYLIFFSGSRTIIVTSAGVIVCILIHNMINVKTKEKRKKYIKILIGIVFGVLISYGILLATGNKTVLRIQQLFSIKHIWNNPNETLLTRIKTFSYYIKKILEKPWGEGFGCYLPLVNQYDKFHSKSMDSYYTDNALINIGMKAGLIAMITYGVIILYPVIKLYREKKMRSYILVYIGYAFSSLLMTSQGIKNYQTAILFNLFNVVLCKIIPEKDQQNKIVDLRQNDSENIGKSVIIHLLNFDKFTVGYVNFMQMKMNLWEHHFIIPDKDVKEELSNHNNIYFVKNFFCVLLNPKLFKMLKQSDKIIVSGVFESWKTVLFMGQMNRKKTYLHFWGEDFYGLRNNETGIRSKVKRELKQFIFKKCGGLIFLIEDEYDKFRNITHVENSHYVAPMPSDPRKVIRYADYRIETHNNKLKILVGNSATKTNHHSEVFEMLAKFVGEGLEVYCPLSYGNDKYREQVIEKGQTIFGNCFYPILEYMEKEEYVRFLAQCDIGIFYNDRQQALGNIHILLGLGKKLFLRTETSMWNNLKREGLIVFPVETIHNITYKNLGAQEEDIKINNIRIMDARDVNKNAIEAWQKVFKLEP